MDFPGCLVSVALAWPVVDSVEHGLDLLVADAGEVGALGEVLPDQPVGVLVAAALPGMVRQGEVAYRAAGPFDLPEIGELHAAVQGHGPAFRMPGKRPDLHVGDVPLGVRGGASSREQAAFTVHERDQARARAPAHDGVALPVAEPGALLRLRGALPDGPDARDLATPLLGTVPAVAALALVARPSRHQGAAAPSVRGRS